MTPWFANRCECCPTCVDGEASCPESYAFSVTTPEFEPVVNGQCYTYSSTSNTLSIKPMTTTGVMFSNTVGAHNCNINANVVSGSGSTSVYDFTISQYGAMRKMCAGDDCDSGGTSEPRNIVNSVGSASVIPSGSSQNLSSGMFIGYCPDGSGGIYKRPCMESHFNIITAEGSATIGSDPPNTYALAVYVWNMIDATGLYGSRTGGGGAHNNGANCDDDWHNDTQRIKDYTIAVGTCCFNYGKYRVIKYQDSCMSCAYDQGTASGTKVHSILPFEGSPQHPNITMFLRDYACVGDCVCSNYWDTANCTPCGGNNCSGGGYPNGTVCHGAGTDYSDLTKWKWSLG